MKQISYVVPSAEFSVSEIAGHSLALVRDEQGFLNEEELGILIGLLQHTLDAMSNNDISQNEILSACEKAHADMLMSPSQWVFPPSFGKSPRVGQCVYFIHDPASHKIKIGHTTYLTSRMAGIRNATNKEKHELEIIAVVACNQARELEYYIHQNLKQFNLHGEWFQAGPVIDFIARASGTKPEVKP